MGAGQSSDRITITDVAAACGVSITTVSKAFNYRPGSTDISSATRDRVLAAAARLGYEPDWSKRRNASRRTGTIGLLFARSHLFTGGTYGRLTEQLALSAASRGWRMLLVPVIGEDSDWRRLAGRYKLDGCVLTTPLPSGLDASGGRIPAVVVNDCCDAPLPQFTFDDNADAATVVDHLHRSGRRRIAYLDTVRPGPGDHYSENERRAGYLAAVERHGLRAQVLGGGEDLVACWRDADAPDAVVAYDGRAAASMVVHLRAAAIAVPEQVAVVACDDSQSPHVIGAAFSALALPIPRLCREALDELDALISGRRQPAGERHRFPGTIDAGPTG